MELGKRRDDNDDRESKKVKLSDDGEGPAPPSRVVHVRNLPMDCTDYELRMLVPQHLQPVQHLFLKGKGQAFIEFRDPATATQFIQQCEMQPARVRNKQVYLQFSRRQGLDLSASSSSSSSSTPSYSGTGNTIIHVSIIECLYLINVEILHSVFQYHGPILKIIIFSKKDQSNVVSALIQYADPTAASNAKLTMNGKTLYEGCGILKIQDSNLKELNVEFNNERSWDFTQQRPPGPAHKSTGIIPMNSFQAGGASFHPGAEFAGNSVLLVGNLNEQKVTPDILYALFSCYGDIQKIKILFNKRENALIQFGNPQHAATALRMLNGTVLFGKAMTLANSNKNSIKMPPPGSEESSGAFNKDFSNSEFHRFKVAGSKNYQNICPPSSTLHISNIPVADENKLRELFSQYGHVTGFKFFPNNDKMALVQMSSVPEAVEALVNLHLYPITESARLRVSFSKSNI